MTLWAVSLCVGWFTINALATIARVGKSEREITPVGAAFAVAWYAVMVVAVLCWVPR